jgi:cysteine desulfurase
VAYFDFAATAPVLDEVIAAWEFAVRQPGNASATHRDGQKSRLLWEEGRENIARSFGAKPFDVTMTGSGTEAINLAIKGLFWGRNADATRPRIVTTETEHHAALHTVNWLVDHESAVVDFVAVDEYGLIDLDDLRAKLDDDVALVTTLWVSNEIGTIQPIDEIVALALEKGIPVHADAVAAWGHIPLDFDASGLAAMSVSAHKIGGPVGVGAVAVARGWNVVPSIHGGSQQRLRSGSLDVAGTYAAGVAAGRALNHVREHGDRMRSLANRLAAGLRDSIPGVVFRGHPTSRTVDNVHITVPGLDTVSAMFLLDELGHFVSAGSACQAGVNSPSHVLRAIGVADSEGPLRFTLGPSTTESDIDEVLAVLPGIIARTRTLA